MPQGSIINNNIQAVVNAQKLVTAGQDNINKARVPGAHRVNPEITYGRTGTINIALKRASDPYVTALLNKIITSASATALVKDSFTYLQSAITNQTTKGSKFAEEMVSFIKNANQIVSKSTPYLKQAFVRQGAKLAETLSNTTNEVLDLRLAAVRAFPRSLTAANHIMFELFNLNTALSGADSNPDLLDKRDLLINKLSEFFDIKVSESANGHALISTTNGSLNLVDSTTYAKFNYNGVISTKSFLKEDSYTNPIKMDHINASGQITGTFEVVDGIGPQIRKISDGKITSYIELRDNILFKAGETVKALAAEVFNNVNAIHNKYSPFPPKTSLTSKDLIPSEQIGWGGGGKLTIAAVNKNTGDSLGGGNSGAVRPFTLDLNTLPTNSLITSPSISDMINEINSYLGNGLAENRLALGGFLETAIPPNLPQQTYLLNNIKMVGMTNIDAAGNFVFDLELDGSQYFGSKVQVLSVTSPAGQAANLPQTFELAKGEHTRTNQRIDVGGIVGGAQNINVRIRVIGDNGVIQEGTATFNINPTLAGGTQTLNKRVSGTPALVGPGAILNTGSDIHAPIAVAKLVDENGVEIWVNSGQPGKLVIETYNGDNGLVISSDLDNTTNGFSNFFGINNFFVKDITPGTSVQAVDQGNGASASATMQFANAIVNNDTVTINGIAFTFANPLTGAANEVFRAITRDVSLTNLRNAINNHPELSSIVRADLNLPTGDTLTITAKNLGTSSNLLTLTTNLTGGGTVNITPLNGVPTGALAVNNSSLGGGTDINVLTQKYTPRIGPTESKFFEDTASLDKLILSFEGNEFVPVNSNTLDGYANFITELLSNQLNVAKVEADVTKTVKEDFDKKLQASVGINEKQSFLTLMTMLNL